MKTAYLFDYLPGAEGLWKTATEQKKPSDPYLTGATILAGTTLGTGLGFMGGRLAGRGLDAVFKSMGHAEGTPSKYVQYIGTGAGALAGLAMALHRIREQQEIARALSSNHNEPTGGTPGQ